MFLNVLSKSDGGAGGPRWPPLDTPVPSGKTGQEETAVGGERLGETKIILGFWGGYEMVVNSLLDVQVSERDAGGSFVDGK